MGISQPRNVKKNIQRKHFKEIKHKSYSSTNHCKKLITDAVLERAHSASFLYLNIFRRYCYIIIINDVPKLLFNSIHYHF